MTRASTKRAIAVFSPPGGNLSGFAIFPGWKKRWKSSGEAHREWRPERRRPAGWLWSVPTGEWEIGISRWALVSWVALALSARAVFSGVLQGIQGQIDDHPKAVCGPLTPVGSPCKFLHDRPLYIPSNEYFCTVSLVWHKNIFAVLNSFVKPVDLRTFY